MFDAPNIPFKHWQMRRDGNVAVFGAVAAEIEDIEQEIRQCILTPPGSVPLEPEQGCDLERHRDRNLDHRRVWIAAEVRRALQRDVPRIELVGVSAQFEATTVRIAVRWQPRGDVAREFVTEVAYAS